MIIWLLGSIKPSFHQGSDVQSPPDPVKRRFPVEEPEQSSHDRVM